MCAHLRVLALEALSRVVRIAAAILDDGQILDRQRARRDLVEEPPVMGRDHSRCALLDEEVLQPLRRRHIEVVRGFVEEQNVGVIEQQAREPETGSLATRERSERAIDEPAEAAPAKDPPERRLEVVPARVLEVMLRIGIAFERRRIAARDLVLETPQLALELTEMRGRATRVLDDRARRILEELLPQEADPGAARERDGAAVGRIETGRDAQQRGLPRPIRADEADAVALADPERDVLQHLTLPVPPRDGLDRQNAHLTILRCSTARTAGNP